jgi:hypothetical protein
MLTTLAVITGVSGRCRALIYQAVAANATRNGNRSTFGALQSPATNYWCWARLSFPTRNPAVGSQGGVDGGVDRPDLSKGGWGFRYRLVRQG